MDWNKQIQLHKQLEQYETAIKELNSLAEHFSDPEYDGSLYAGAFIDEVKEQPKKTGLGIMNMLYERQEPIGGKVQLKDEMALEMLGGMLRVLYEQRDNIRKQIRNI